MAEIYHFGDLPDGRSSHYTILRNKQQEVFLADFGARLLAWRIKVNGSWRNVVLGGQNLDYYLDKGVSIGATIGRYANRIAGAAFQLNGRTFPLEVNEPPNHLHGGSPGFAGQIWQADWHSNAVNFSYASPDGEGGYPGNLSVVVRYQLNDEGLSIHYSVATDEMTVINLTHHSYFNLAGSASIHEHKLQVSADEYLPVTVAKLPLGVPQPVVGTPFDFRSPRRLGAGLESITDNVQLHQCGGYDHCFILGEAEPAAVLSSDDLMLTVMTSEPGLQVYTANHMSPRYQGVALETQHLPDSPNHPEFPSTLLEPGQQFESFTHYHLCER